MNYLKNKDTIVIVPDKIDNSKIVEVPHNRNTLTYIHIDLTRSGLDLTYSYWLD
jgi:hypothetical protein